MSDLKPCPFCGKSDDLKINDATRIIGTYNLIHRCKIIGPIKVESTVDAGVAAIWNNRHEPDQSIIAALTEALEWYREQADAAARHSIKVSPNALTAIIQALALDAGGRAKAALSLAKEKASDV
jgi:hypothetical protein